MNPEWRSRYETAVAAAHQAGQFALQHFDQNIAVEWKADQSPVTLADRGAEELLRTTLLGKFPRDGFLGEESGATPGDSGFRWIIDPIDGTRSFVRGIPLWATLVGLEYKGELIGGVVASPALTAPLAPGGREVGGEGMTYRALSGDGAFRNNRPIHVSRIAKLDEADIYYSSIAWFEKAGREQQFLRLAKQTRRQRGFGDFYGFVLVAQGSGELMVEHGIKPWDLAALVPIVQEAGGRITDWQGKVNLDSPDVLASNETLHDTALRILNEP
ncbi:MAG: histidinol phosphate phosphatase [Gemmataceae bacterium]|nr:histidinol phosphate phosphatase [Gemmataceae bacterium]